MRIRSGGPRRAGVSDVVSAEEDGDTERACYATPASAPMRFIQAALVVVALPLVLSSCTFNVPLKPAHSDATVAKRIPIAMGYLLTPDFVTYEQRETVNGGHELVFPIGKAAQSAFPDMFARLFSSARPVSGAPGAVPHVEGVDAVIVPRLTESTIQGPGFAGWAGSWYVTLGYGFVVYDPKGREVAHWQVEGTGTNPSGIDWTGMAGSDNAAAALSAALSDVENRFLTGFPNDPSIQQWLQSVYAKSS